jgi:hypothetical protein
MYACFGEQVSVVGNKTGMKFAAQDPDWGVLRSCSRFIARLPVADMIACLFDVVDRLSPSAKLVPGYLASRSFWTVTKFD